MKPNCESEFLKCKLSQIEGGEKSLYVLAIKTNFFAFILIQVCSFKVLLFLSGGEKIQKLLI